MPEPLPGQGLDQVQLRGLRFSGAHGVLPEEHERPQPFEVDLDVFMDLRPAGTSDDLDLTVDYARLCAVVGAVLEGEHVQLLETLAERVATGVLQACEGRARSVAVTVRKLRPPVPVRMSFAAVRICRP